MLQLLVILVACEAKVAMIDCLFFRYQFPLDRPVIDILSGSMEALSIQPEIIIVPPSQT